METVMETVEEVLGKVRKTLEKRPEVVVGYFYGSRARGEAVESSDIDIGVLLHPDFEPKGWYIGGLYNDLQDTSVDYKVEGYILNNKSPSYRYEVISPRRVVFCRDDELRTEFEVKTMREYLEYAPFFEEKYEALVEKAKERVRHGV